MSPDAVSPQCRTVGCRLGTKTNRRPTSVAIVAPTAPIFAVNDESANLRSRLGGSGSPIVVRLAAGPAAGARSGCGGTTSKGRDRADSRVRHRKTHDARRALDDGTGVVLPPAREVVARGR